MSSIITAKKISYAIESENAEYITISETNNKLKIETSIPGNKKVAQFRKTTDNQLDMRRILIFSKTFLHI